MCCISTRLWNNPQKQSHHSPRTDQFWDEITTATRWKNPWLICHVLVYYSFIWFYRDDNGIMMGSYWDIDGYNIPGLVMTNSLLLKMAIYSGFSHEKWWFSIVFCMFTRGYMVVNLYILYSIWLVVYLPLWKIWKSVGMMTFPIYGKS